MGSVDRKVYKTSISTYQVNRMEAVVQTEKKGRTDVWTPDAKLRRKSIHTTWKKSPKSRTVTSRKVVVEEHVKKVCGVRKDNKKLRNWLKNNTRKPDRCEGKKQLFSCYQNKLQCYSRKPVFTKSTHLVIKITVCTYICTTCSKTFSITTSAHA